MDRYELLRVIEKNLKKMDTIEGRLENDLKKAIMEKHIYNANETNDNQVIIPISGKDEMEVRKKILKRLKEGTIDLYNNIVEWNNKTYFVGEFLRNKENLNDLLKDDDSKENIQKSLNVTRNKFLNNINKIIGEGGYKYRNRSPDKIMRSIMDTTSKYINPMFYMLLHRFWESVISNNSINRDLSFTSDYKIDISNKSKTEKSINYILTEIFSMFRKSFDTDIMFNTRLFGSSFNREDKQNLAERVSKYTIMDEVMPWLFLPDVVFKNYEEYDLLARLFRIGEVSVDKVFTERVLLKKNDTDDVINYPVYVGGVDNKIRYYFGELSRVYLELILLEQKYSKNTDIKIENINYYDDICCMKCYIEMLMLIMQLFYILHIYHWVLNLDSNTNMQNIISKLVNDYELEMKQLVIVSNKLGLIIEGGVPDNDITKFMENLSMSEEKKKKLGDVLDIVKQNGGTRMLDEFSEAVGNTRYDIIQDTKNEIDKKVEGIENILNLLNKINNEKLSLSYILGEHKNEINNLFDSMWSGYNEQENWFKNNLDKLLNKKVNYESLANIFNDVEEQNSFINILRRIEMDTIEDLLDEDYEDTESEIVEELHRKLKKMESRRDREMMEDKFIDKKEEEKEMEEQEEIDTDELYGDDELVKKVIIRFKKIKEINEDEPEDSEDSTENISPVEKPELTGGNRQMIGGDLSAELVDKENPNLLLSFVTDTDLIQESGIHSLHSFLDGKFARRISLYKKNNFKYGFNNEERLYFNLVNQVGYDKDLARVISVGYKYFLDTYLFNILRRLDHQVFGGICYCKNENEEANWYSLYINSNKRSYGKNKLGKITMMVRDALFDTYLRYKRSFRKTTLIGINERDVVAEDETNIMNQIHYLHKPYFVPKLHSKRGVSAANQFNFGKELGHKNIINEYVNRLGKQWNLRDRLNDIFEGEDKSLLNKLTKLLSKDEPEIYLEEFTDLDVIDTTIRLSFNALLDIDEDSSSRIMSLSNLDTKVKKIFGNGYLYVNKLKADRIYSNTNGESVGIDFDNILMSYKDNCLQVRKVKFMNMNALNSWQKITWNSLSNTDIDDVNISSTWFQVSQPVSYSLDYIVENLRGKDGMSLRDIYQKLKLMNNIEKYNLVTVYDVVLNISLMQNNSSVGVEKFYRDLILGDESIDFILKLLKDQLFKKDDDLEEILLHKIKKSGGNDSIIFSISLWSSSGSVNIEEIGERIDKLDYKKLNDELKSYYFTTDEDSKNIKKVKDFFKYKVGKLFNNRKLANKDILENIGLEGSTEEEIYQNMVFSIEINDNKFGGFMEESNRYKAIRCWIYKKLRSIYKMFYKSIEEDISILPFLNYYFKFNANKLKEIQKYFIFDDKYTREFTTINEYFEEIQNSFYLSEDVNEVESEDDKIDITLLFDVVLSDDLFIKDMDEPIIEKIRMGTVNLLTRDSPDYRAFRSYHLVKFIKNSIEIHNNQNVNDDKTSVQLISMKEMYRNYVLNNKLFNVEYDNLKSLAIGKRNTNLYIKEMLEEIMTNMLSEEKLTRKQLDSIYMWFKDARDSQDIIDIDVNKMLEKQKYIKKLLEEIIKEDIDTAIEGEKYIDDSSVPSNRFQNIKLWNETVIDTFVYLRVLANGLLVDRYDDGMFNKIVNIRNFRKLTNKKYKEEEIYTRDFFTSLYSLVDKNKLPNGINFMGRIRSNYNNLYNDLVINSKNRRLMGNFVYEDDIFYNQSQLPGHIYLADAPQWKESTNRKLIDNKPMIYGGSNDNMKETISETEVRNIYAELISNFDKNMIKYLIPMKEYKSYLGNNIEKIIPDYKTEYESFCKGKFWYYNSINPIDNMPLSRKIQVLVYQKERKNQKGLYSLGEYENEDANLNVIRFIDGIDTYIIWRMLTHCFVIAKAITSGFKVKKSGIKKLMKSYFEGLFYLISLARSSGSPSEICDYLYKNGTDAEFCKVNGKSIRKNALDKLFSSKYFGRTYMKTSVETAQLSFKIFESSNRHMFYLYRIIFLLTKVFDITIDFKYDRVGKLEEDDSEDGIIKIKAKKALKKVKGVKDKVLAESKVLRDGESLLMETKQRLLNICNKTELETYWYQMGISDETGKLLDNLFLGTECRNPWYNLFRLNDLKTGIQLENSLVNKGLMMTNFIPGGFSGIANYKDVLTEENTNNMKISWMEKGLLEKLTYIYYFMPFSIKSLKQNESLYLDLISPLYKFFSNLGDIKKIPSNTANLAKMPFVVTNNIAKNIVGPCSHFKVGISSDIVDFVIKSFNEANYNFPIFTQKMALRELKAKDDFFGAKDAIFGDIKSTLKTSGKYRLFSHLFDSAYMLEYILMNLGKNTLRKLLESLIKTDKEKNTLDTISKILNETIGLKLEYDDSLGQYTINEAIYNSRILVKPELAMLVNSMSKGNLKAQTSYYESLFNSIGNQTGIKLNLQNLVEPNDLDNLVGNYKGGGEKEEDLKARFNRFIDNINKYQDLNASTKITRITETVNKLKDILKENDTINKYLELHKNYSGVFVEDSTDDDSPKMNSFISKIVTYDDTVGDYALRNKLCLVSNIEDSIVECYFAGKESSGEKKVGVAVYYYGKNKFIFKGEWQEPLFTGVIEIHDGENNSGTLYGKFNKKNNWYETTDKSYYLNSSGGHNNTAIKLLNNLKISYKFEDKYKEGKEIESDEFNHLSIPFNLEASNAETEEKTAIGKNLSKFLESSESTDSVGSEGSESSTDEISVSSKLDEEVEKLKIQENKIKEFKELLQKIKTGSYKDYTEAKNKLKKFKETNNDYEEFIDQVLEILEISMAIKV